jgi:hypothetical protein
LAASFISNQACNLADLAHDRVRRDARFRTRLDNNGQRAGRKLNKYAAFDPQRTLGVRQPIRGLSHLFDALRCGINSAYAVATAESKYAE